MIFHLFHPVVRTMISFPGIALQEIVHKAICLYYHIPTYKHKYVFFTKKKQPNTIIYTSKQAFYILFIPFLINSFLCAFLTIEGIIDIEAHSTSMTSMNFLGLLYLYMKVKW